MLLLLQFKYNDMKKIIGLDLGTTSIGWAVVNEAENDSEKSSIVRLGVRVNPLTVDEKNNFEKGRPITTNSDRTQKRSKRRKMHRYKMRRDNLIEVLKREGFITDQTILAEHGNNTTFETYRLRAKAVSEEVSLEQFARILLMINKKRGYKSSRKAKNEEEGSLIDGMSIAKELYEKDMTPGQYSLSLLESGKKTLPDYYRSDLQSEFDKIWSVQKTYYPNQLSDELKDSLIGKNSRQTWAIIADKTVWPQEVKQWNETLAKTEHFVREYKLKGIKREGKRDEQKLENYKWRVSALKNKLEPEQLAIVFQEINTQINSSSGYLGAISDRSKELYFNKQTVGQYFMQLLDEDPNTSLTNRVFYRQDYMDEFETIWEKQSEFHPELTQNLKREIRDIIIFYQRRLKSQKGLISYCELESWEIDVVRNGKVEKKTIGQRVIPRSSPLFQEFKIWQMLNDVEVFVKDARTKKRRQVKNPSLFEESNPSEILQIHGRRRLTEDEMILVASELSIRSEMKKEDVLKLLFDDWRSLDLNFKKLDGNKTGNALFEAYSKIIEMSGHFIDWKQSADDIIADAKKVFDALGWNSNILSFDSSKDLQSQDYYMLWHILYSYESDNSNTGNESLINKLVSFCGFEKEYAVVLSNVSFLDDYGSLSAKAIGKILPHLKDGNDYYLACELAGYKHSKSSITKEENEARILKDSLDLLPKNSLRNPVVEKILNQMVNVVNALMDEYGRPDEFRVELARELKKNQREREEMTRAINESTRVNKEIREVLMMEFGLPNVTRNDIVRYKLYQELKENGYHTLYSNTYISKEKLFSKDFDIEHIIPRSRLFDDSYSNKTLELRSINEEKGNQTAYDFVLSKYGETGLEEYINRCQALFPKDSAKLKKLLMQEADIPEGFVERDLRNTQYIAKKALSMLKNVCRNVVATTGSITDELRSDWQLIDVMKELNWDKYEEQGLVDYYKDKDGRSIGRIKDWSKRNDHRHHAMDALTVSFTNPALIQYYNNMNASSDKTGAIYQIKNKYFKEGRAISPIPLNEFRAEAKRHLENILVSIKAKNKVVTKNINVTKTGKGGTNKKIQLTPRGQLHNDTIYGSHKRVFYVEEKVGSSFDKEKISRVSNAKYRHALMERLEANAMNPKKAFTGANALSKKPIWIDQERGLQLPERVKVRNEEVVYTTRKLVDENLNVGKVIDPKVRAILENRLKEYGTAKKAFSNLDENPIYLNKEKGITIKRVTISGINNAYALREKDGKNGEKAPKDFVSTSNNHHVALFKRAIIDKDGVEGYEFCEVVVPFIEAVARVNFGDPIINFDYGKNEGWEFMFTMKQNEYFVFPNAKTGFDPHAIDLLDPKNYALISPNLFRVQKFSTKYYVFRHHLETSVKDVEELRDITWKRIQSLDSRLLGMVKVRIDHIGRIVSVGEY